ncbi:cytochrome P450 [Streptomyces sp. H27-C3]|nr:cytochrome P450 [Streptomyces sp. H27-C3]MDJ0463307.1 cytochrome P450 [Streptomyces sp. H27-C3]
MTTDAGAAVDVQPQEYRTVPGPRGLPFLGNLAQFGKNPLAFFERLRRYGDLVRWRFGRTPCLFVADPQLVGELITEVERSFDQPELGIAFRTLMGNGVIVARGPDWRGKRSLVQPSVRPKQVRSYATTMTECAVELADGWSDGERVDIKREMAVLTQRIAVRTVFGAGTAADAEAIGRAMDVAQQEIGAEFSGIGALLPDWVPTPGRARINRAAAVIDAEVAQVVERHRSGDGERPDLLSRLLAAQDETGARLSDDEIRDETVTLYIAGHETTSSTLVCAWYLLARDPRVRAALAEELERVLGEIRGAQHAPVVPGQRHMERAGPPFRDGRGAVHRAREAARDRRHRVRSPPRSIAAHSASSSRRSCAAPTARSPGTARPRR